MTHTTHVACCDAADPRLAADDAGADAALDADSNAAAVRVSVTDADMDHLMANVCASIGCRRPPPRSHVDVAESCYVNACCEPCLDSHISSHSHSHSKECGLLQCGRC